MRRFTVAALGAACLAAAGCIEGEQVFTLNPDGSGKVAVDVVCAPPFELGGPPPRPGRGPAQLLRRMVRPVLTAPGVTAWKDLSVGFTPDGRFKLAGTAYFKKLEDLDLKTNVHLGLGLGLTRGGDGALVLARKDQDKAAPDDPTGMLPGGKKKTPEEIARMTDDQLDDYIMKERIRFQTSKGFLIALFTDAKVKTTVHLPGEPARVGGFTADGRRLTLVIEGNKSIAAINTFLARDKVELRKAFRSKDGAWIIEEILTEFNPKNALTATIPKPTGPLFDYEKEVKDAVAAYPELRKRLKLGPDVPLPEGTAAPSQRSFPK